MFCSIRNALIVFVGASMLLLSACSSGGDTANSEHHAVLAPTIVSAIPSCNDDGVCQASISWSQDGYAADYKAYAVLINSDGTTQTFPFAEKASDNKGVLTGLRANSTYEVYMYAEYAGKKSGSSALTGFTTSLDLATVTVGGLSAKETKVTVDFKQAGVIEASTEVKLTNGAGQSVLHLQQGESYDVSAQAVSGYKVQYSESPFTASPGFVEHVTYTADVPPPPPTPSAKGFFAPYDDAAGWPFYKFADESAKSGVKHYTLAFIVQQAVPAPAAGACVPTWGGYGTYAVAGSDWSKDILAQVDKLRAEGGDVVVSIGGQANSPLAACPSITAEQLATQYENIVKQFDLKYLDFDIEGTWVADAATISLRDQALVIFQKKYPAVKVMFTLPVLPSGLDANGLHVVNDALDKGVNLSYVNIMTMDYGDSACPSKNMATCGNQAVANLYTQLQTAYANHSIAKTSAELWGMIGTTPMIGQNDVASEKLSLDGARSILSYATTNKLGFMGMWSINRDKQCPSGSSAGPTCSGVTQDDYGFAKIFNAFTQK